MNNSKKIAIIVLLAYLIVSCQSAKIVFSNSDFREIKKYQVYEDGWLLGELPLEINFQKAFISKNIFHATGYVLSHEDKEALTNAVISVCRKGEKEITIFETKKDGYFDIKIKDFSKYDTLKVFSLSYLTEYYEIKTLLNNKGVR